MAAFIAWIAEACSPDALALDIGAGYDRNRADAAVRPLVSCVVGVDPSDSILDNVAVHERHQMSLEEFARTDERQFDVVFACWLLEHVLEPAEFFAGCRRLLRPGGTFFAITPNLWHYFGLTTRAAAALGLEDWALDRIMGSRSKAEYHYPTRYRSNSIRALEHLLADAGFRSVEFRCCDSPADYDYVIPMPLHWFPRLYSRLVYRLRLPSLMGRLMLRAT
jgi:SAM-dependent methyltransferase